MRTIDDRPERLFLLFVLVHTFCWTVVPALVNPNLPYDVIEGLAWGHEWQWGYYKHPPIKPWFLEAMAVVSGRADWAMYLLSQLCVVGAFWAVWRLAREFFSPAMALVAVLLLEGVYYHNFTSPEFNVNVAQLPFWALTILFTWWGLTRRTTLPWVLAGACIGLGFLSKYVFLFLVMAIVVMLFAVREFRPVLKSPGPWIGALVSLAVAAPHLYWFVANDFPTIAYAVEMADPGKPSLFNHIFYPLRLLVGQSLILIPVLLMLLTLRRKEGELPEPVQTSTAAGPFLLFTALGPPLLMALMSALFGWKIRSMWATPLFLTASVTLIYFLRERLTTVRLRGFTIALGLLFSLSLLAYAGHAFIGPAFTERPKRVHFPGLALADEVTRRWHDHFEKPPEIIIGSYWVAGNVAYYAPHRATVFIDADPGKAPWVTPEQMRRHGAVIIGFSRREALQMVPFDPERVIDTGPVTLAPEYWKDLKPFEFWMLILPPSDKAGADLGRIAVDGATDRAAMAEDAVTSALQRW
ncbi:glycosyltransferase family 39 protein [Desulfatitalea alkaliphila]|uniref:Glycosyltransferase family 39 protein n=1 Tax=Desulfatitalea alkaliphila TaxID=2929485 RepID=A0AA41R1H9_9BACT|nr:glycosyltransferase family 39 protein [Desulfatitalea alkaliphila]MCJ8500734.1 glycosyltransferase family 39 protein [Desulfatitalea alkaliphila]